MLLQPIIKPFLKRIYLVLNRTSFELLSFFQFMSKSFQFSFSVLNILLQWSFRTTLAWFRSFTATVVLFDNCTDFNTVRPHIFNKFTSYLLVWVFYFFHYLFRLTDGFLAYAVEVVIMESHVHILEGIRCIAFTIMENTDSFILDKVDVQIDFVEITKCSKLKLSKPSTVHCQSFQVRRVVTGLAKEILVFMFIV